MFLFRRGCKKSGVLPSEHNNFFCRHKTKSDGHALRYSLQHFDCTVGEEESGQERKRGKETKR